MPETAAGILLLVQGWWSQNGKILRGRTGQGKDFVSWTYSKDTDLPICYLINHSNSVWGRLCYPERAGWVNQEVKLLRVTQHVGGGFQIQTEVCSASRAVLKLLWHPSFTSHEEWTWGVRVGWPLFSSFFYFFFILTLLPNIWPFLTSISPCARQLDQMFTEVLFGSKIFWNAW